MDLPLTLQWSQGNSNACAHICVAVAALVVRSGSRVLAPGMVDEAAVTEAGRLGIRSHRWALEERQKKTPVDTDLFFTAGYVVTEEEKAARARGVDVFWDRHEASGWLTRRGIIAADSRGVGAGYTPALVDEVRGAWEHTARDGRYRAMVITDHEQYTRLAIFSPGTMWYYDSHGTQGAQLWVFQEPAQLLITMLRKSGITDDAELAKAAHQMHHSDACESEPWTTTRDAVHKRYELVVLSRRAQ